MELRTHRRTMSRPWVCGISLLLLLGSGALLLAGCTNEEPFADADGDGVGPAVDCNDEDPAIHPGAVDIPYDGIDQDCHDGDLVDADDDGADGMDAGGDDCDDTDPSSFPGAPEVPYDGIDQDCDGTDLEDVDGDGYGAVEAGGEDCNDRRAESNPAGVEVCDDGVDQDCTGEDLVCDLHDDDLDGFSEAEGDCNDMDSSIHPDAGETPYNGRDDDCDLTTPDDDLDGDGFLQVGGGDCDDSDPQSYPRAEEIPYDGIDQDCSGTDLVDVDRDGYDSVAAGGTDCDDNRGDINPSVAEIPYDEVDQNCDGVDVIDPGLALTTAAGTQSSPQVAAGDSRFLVVWVDARGGAETEIFGRLLDADGSALGSEFIIYSGPSAIGSLGLAYGTSRYLVTWQTGRRILGQRLDADGRLISTEFDLQETPAGDSGPAVTFTGTAFLVAWQRAIPCGMWCNPTKQIWTRRILPDGTGLPDVNAAGPGTNVSWSKLAMATGSSSVLIAIRQTASGGQTRTLALATDLTGVGLGAPVDLTAGDNPTVAFDGTNYLVAGHTGGADSNLIGNLIDQSGAVLSSHTVSNAGAAQTLPSVAFVSGAYRVVFQDNRNTLAGVYSQSVNPDGTYLDTPVAVNRVLVAALTNATSPRITGLGSDALVAYQRDGDIFTALITL